MGIGSSIARGIIRGVIQGARQVARERARVERYHQRRARVGLAHALVAQDFAIPLVQGSGDRITPKEHDKLQELSNNANYHGDFLLEHADEANEQYLNNYALAIKRLAVFTLKLCQKCNVLNVYSVTYDAKRKMIMLNGQDHYSLM